MVHFSVATEYRYIFSKSKTTMETFWLQCVAFKNMKMPPGFADMPDLTTLHKGATVEVKGRLRNIKFTDSNGVESTQIEVFAQDLKVLAPLY